MNRALEDALQALTDALSLASEPKPLALTALEVAEGLFLVAHGWTKVEDASTALDWKGEPITLWKCPTTGQLRDTNDAVGLQKARIAHGI